MLDQVFRVSTDPSLRVGSFFIKMTYGVPVIVVGQVGHQGNLHITFFNGWAKRLFHLVLILHIIGIAIVLMAKRGIKRQIVRFLSRPISIIPGKPRRDIEDRVVIRPDELSQKP